MDFLRTYIFKNEPLISCISFMCLSNVLISGEFSFDERNGQLIRGSFLKNPYFKRLNEQKDNKFY